MCSTFLATYGHTITFAYCTTVHVQGRNGIEQLGDSLAKLHHQTSEVSRRADFIASKKRSALEQRLMDEYEAAVDVFEKRERTAFAEQLKQIENDHKSRIESITSQHM